jgi:Ca2+-binding EF-hand superfamily protein
MRIRVFGGLLAMVLLSAAELRADDSTLFSRIDANADGLITASEIEGEGKSLYSRLLRTSDKNGDGKLSKEEFDAGLKAGSEKFEMSTSAMTPSSMTPGGMPGGPAAGKPGEMLANLQQMLANIDRDKNGKISESEAPPRLKSSFKQFDKDGDGELDKREIGAAMMSMRPGAGAPGKPPGKVEQPKKKKKE